MSLPTTLSGKSLIFALTVVIVWGMNFVIIKTGLQGLPPFLMGAMRFSLVAFPLVFFIPRPSVAFKWVLAYGLTISFLQFSCLFFAMSHGMPAGLASLVLQSQVFFTLGLSAVFFRDRLHYSNKIGLLIACFGLGLLGMESILHAEHSTMSWLGFVLTLCAASCWACGNIFSKRMGTVDLFPVVVWGSLVAAIPFCLLALILEGSQISAALRAMTSASVLAMAYQSYISSLLGFTLWARLLAHLPARTVVPLTLLVPIIGLSSAWFFLGEALSPLQISGALVVMFGLLINVWGGVLWGTIRVWFVRTP